MKDRNIFIGIAVLIVLILGVLFIYEYNQSKKPTTYYPCVDKVTYDKLNSGEINDRTLCQSQVVNVKDCQLINVDGESGKSCYGNKIQIACSCFSALD